MKKLVLILFTAALLTSIIGCSASYQTETLPTVSLNYTYAELIAMPDDQLLDLFITNGLEIEESLIDDLGIENIQEIFKMEFEHFRKGKTHLSYKGYLHIAQQTAEIYARICSDSPDATLPVEPTQSKLPGNFELVSPMYAKGYGSIRELMEDVTLIVRANPVSVESESDFAVCYVLKVLQSSVEGIHTIHLRQMKDEHQLEIGQEVVLALAPDEGEGYYHIPAGGAGLFKVNNATTAVEGELLDDLLENAPTLLPDDSKITLDVVFDMLCNFE